MLTPHGVRKVRLQLLGLRVVLLRESPPQVEKLRNHFRSHLLLCDAPREFRQRLLGLLVLLLLHPRERHAPDGACHAIQELHDLSTVAAKILVLWRAKRRAHIPAFTACCGIARLCVRKACLRHGVAVLRGDLRARRARHEAVVVGRSVPLWHALGARKRLRLRRLRCSGLRRCGVGLLHRLRLGLGHHLRLRKWGSCLRLWLRLGKRRSCRCRLRNWPRNRDARWHRRR
mmetsp:Transcript_5458/g.21582  ORF Transcript_5458/g.21582 Transcript_5458/m.21582 type:complete len:230 (-) Transcript_5458:42-731(-)